MSHTPATVLHREDAAWLAGLLDGEGCFDSPRGNPRVRVKMTDLDVVIRAADLMQAATYTETPWQGNHKTLLIAQITGEKAVGIMRALLPWLGSRRSAKVTEIVTAFEDRRRTRTAPLKAVS